MTSLITLYVLLSIVAFVVGSVTWYSGNEFHDPNEAKWGARTALLCWLWPVPVAYGLFIITRKMIKDAL